MFIFSLVVGTGPAIKIESRTFENILNEKLILMTSLMQIYLEFILVEKLICPLRNRYLLLQDRCLVIHLLCVACCKRGEAFDESQ